MLFLKVLVLRTRLSKSLNSHGWVCSTQLATLNGAFEGPCRRIGARHGLTDAMSQRSHTALIHAAPGLSLSLHHRRLPVRHVVPRFPLVLASPRAISRGYSAHAGRWFALPGCSVLRAVSAARRAAVFVARCSAVFILQPRDVSFVHHLTIFVAHRPAVIVAHRPVVFVAQHPLVCIVQRPAVFIAHHPVVFVITHHPAVFIAHQSAASIVQHPFIA